MKKIVIGMLAHVDAGKTTLSEAMLYLSGAIRKFGRVDHRDSFLDTFSQERQRGITIFSKQAIFEYGDTHFTLLDTPGHIDFSAEMERTIQVLDYAVLVISGTDGIQSHTQTLWHLLQKYHVPCFIFINKMDLAGAEKEHILNQLHVKFSDGCTDFTEIYNDIWYETVAAVDDDMLEAYCLNNTVSALSVKKAIKQRKLFPCIFGSALKMHGVEKLLTILDEFTEMSPDDGIFGAKVFKISEDKQGQRLTFMKIMGGVLHVRDVLKSDKNTENEKVAQIRLYSGEKFTTAEQADTGTICAVTGIHFAQSGDGLGKEKNNSMPVITPVMTYSLILPPETDQHTAFEKLRSLAEEDPMLHINRNGRNGCIQLDVMGEVQAEILKAMIKERFGFCVDFGRGSIIYKETIADTVEGVGHFEPLRHYAEVHLILKPAERNSGLVFKTECSEDILSRNWQRLILSHLYEKTHIGVLTGSPITDMEITLTSGKAHLKHTEGGDFRQAAFRAVRQGLRSAESILLEPYYDFTLEVPAECVGRAMTDIQRMSGNFEPPCTHDDTAFFTGKAPVSEMINYNTEVIQYTHGKGLLQCRFSGYEPCHNAEQVIAEFNYDPEHDTDNPCDSVFCSHGAGYIVKWNEVPSKMHIASTLGLKASETATIRPLSQYRSQKDIFALDRELIRIFESTYGSFERRHQPQSSTVYTAQPEKDKPVNIKETSDNKKYLLIDGYNVIFSWDHLKKLAEDNIAAARDTLINILCNYQGYNKCDLILVFDAYKVKGQKEEIEQVGGISIVYTKEAETADMYIEKVTHRIAKRHRVYVVTSDHMEQIIILGNGALRISSRAFLEEVRQAENEIRQIIEDTE